MTIRKSIWIKRPPDTAFRVFCDEIGKWWPLKHGFSFGGDRAQDLFLEGRVGGRFFERFTDGTEFEVGRVTAYHPPSIVAFTWRAPEFEAPTSVEVRFIEDREGTRVEVEHSGWEQGPAMQKQGKGYDDGWNIVLDGYRARADAAA